MAVKKDALVKYQQRGSVALAMWVAGKTLLQLLKKQGLGKTDVHFAFNFY